jgi:DHA1 family multidrug resistance protein-like MFS transporter
VERFCRLLSSNRDLVIVTSVLTVTTFTMGSMQPVLPLYAQSLGASIEQWGLIAAMWAIAMAIGEPFWGWCHDHISRVGPLLFRAISASIVFLALLLPAVFWPLFVLNWWRGFSDAASWPTSRSLASRAASPTRIALAMGVLATGARLGGALGAFVGGRVAYAYGYEQVFILSALISLSAIVPIVSRFGWPRWRKTRGAAPTLPAPMSLRRSLKEKTGFNLKLYRPFLTLAGITMLSSVGWFGALTFLPFVVTSSLGGNVADVGVLFNLSSIATAVFTIPMGGLGDQVGQRKMVIGGLTLAALSLVGVAFARSFASLAAFLVMGATGQAAVRPSMDALVSNASSATARGRTMGVYGACEDMGGVLGPVLGSLTWRLGGATVTFLAYSLVVGVGSITAIAALQEGQSRPEEDLTLP